MYAIQEITKSFNFEQIGKIMALQNVKQCDIQMFSFEYLTYKVYVYQ